MATKKKPAKKKAAKKPMAKKAAAKKPVKAKGKAKAAKAKKPAAKKKAAKAKAPKAKAAPKKAAQPIKAGPKPAAKPMVVTPKNKTTKQLSQTELMESIQGSCGFTSKKEAKDFYASFSDMLQEALKRGYKIPLPGLGKIQVRKTKARTGRNPMTGEEIKIPARKKVRFTPNKALKDAVL